MNTSSVIHLLQRQWPRRMLLVTHDLHALKHWNYLLLSKTYNDTCGHRTRKHYLAKSRPPPRHPSVHVSYQEGKVEINSEKKRQTETENMKYRYCDINKISLYSLHLSHIQFQKTNICSKALLNLMVWLSQSCVCQRMNEPVAGPINHLCVSQWMSLLAAGLGWFYLDTVWIVCNHLPDTWFTCDVLKSNSVRSHVFSWKHLNQKY